MKFSIIVPVYMVEDYLDQCVRSVLTQDFKDYELILVDNASPDRCGELCDNYAQEDKRVKVIHRAENGRPAGARNSGLANAEGDYIIFLDSDDWMENDVLQKLSEKIKDEEKDIYFATHNTYCEKTGRIKCNEGNYNNKILSSGDQILILRELLTLDFSWAVWRHVFKRSTLLKNNIFFDETVLGSEDGDFFIKASLVSETFGCLDIPLCCYRVGRADSVISKKNALTIESNLIVAKRWYDYFNDIHDHKEIENCKALKQRFANMFCSSIAMASFLDRKEAERAYNLVESGKYILKDTGGIGHRIIAMLYNSLGASNSSAILKKLYGLYKRIESLKV